MAATASLVLSVGAILLGTVLDAKFRAAGHGDIQQLTDAGYLAAWLASTVVGAVLLVRRPAHPVGWLFTALGWSVVAWGLSQSYGQYAFVVRSESLIGAPLSVRVT